MLLFVLLHLYGEQITPYNEAIISLVNEVFYDYPYLYQGNCPGYDESLCAYAQSMNSLVVLALDEEKVIGLATGIPINESWVKDDLDLQGAYYLGELVVLPSYRGQGLGYKMGKEIESFARDHKYSLLTLLSIDEALLEARAPNGYISSSCTFKKLGYSKHPNLYYDGSWINVGESEPIPHRHRFWTKAL